MRAFRTASERRLNNLTLFAVCVAIWSTTWLAITYQLGAVAPEVSVGYRFLAAALLVAAWCRLRGLALGFRPAEHAFLALMGLFMYSVGYILVYHAERHVASGLVAIGYSASPMLSMIGTRIAFGQPMSARMAIGAAFGIAGIVLVFWPEFTRFSESRNALAGAVLTAAAVLVATLGGLVAQRNHAKNLRGAPAIAWGMGYGGAAALAIAAAAGRPFTIEWSWGYLVSLAYLVVFGSVITFGAWLTLLGRIGAARASYVGVMVPIVALVISTVFENLPWHPLMAAGMAISLAGNVLVLRQAPH